MRPFGTLASLLVGSCLVAGTASPASADAKWDRCIRKLCTSADQTACWIKAGSALCDLDQIQCKELPDQAAAKVGRKDARRWEVQTSYGKGWVSDRMMQIDTAACPELGN